MYIFILYITMLLCNRYVGVLDGGSTGTRFFIFGFDNNGYILKSVWSERIFGGIAVMSENEIYNSIKPLLNHGEGYLFSNKINPRNVKIALNATAGVRLLSYNNQKKVMRAVKNVLRSSNFHVEDRETKVIPGGLEGIYMWETLYILNLYYNNENGNIHKKRFGVIEMGGASAQIAYKLKPRKKNELLLYSESFLGLGEVEALNNLENHKDFHKCKKDIKYCINIIEKILIEVAIPPEDLDQLDHIHLTGYLYWKLKKYFKNKDRIDTNLSEIKNKFTNACISNINTLNRTTGIYQVKENEACYSFLYIIKFLEYFNIQNNQKLIILKDVHGFPLEWTLARAFELLH
ncbi:Nucleoside phosphatase [Spraguea lophii 42_110]|uniref:guanosine-diphosphatase n=1 Tax=Spraguea lophii (strain 42_110) TaxID=1358809 RepID=S7XFD5_SPRLO|nr:Nucleoside phosphatase [Spraguea lophii 42_110]